MNIAFNPSAIAGGLLALAVGIPTTAARAADAAPGASAHASHAAPAPAEAQARRVVRDKESGKLRAPNAEELEAMLEADKAAGITAPSGDKTPVSVRQHPSGMKSAVLGRDYLATLKAERSADGKLVLKHADPAHEHPTAAPKLPTE